eukprot:SAG31_NODE_1217_length_9319_cov_20.281345_1_plen_143_part_00
MATDARAQLETTSGHGSCGVRPRGLIRFRKEGRQGLSLLSRFYGTFPAESPMYAARNPGLIERVSPCRENSSRAEHARWSRWDAGARPLRRKEQPIGRPRRSTEWRGRAQQGGAAASDEEPHAASVFTNVIPEKNVSKFRKD